MTHPQATVRLAHFSDIHLTVPRLGWVLRDLVSKRVSGWFHLRALGRGRRFVHAEAVVRAMVAEFRERRPDALVFSGDATALGFAAEFDHASAALSIGDESLPPGVAVPGNHDYYTRAAVGSGAMEGAFAPWQTGFRVDHHVYPFARRIGPLWLVAVNSCTANVRPWDASGAVGADQRERLRVLLARLDEGPRVLAAHYPVCLADGEPEGRWHGLHDLTDVIKVTADGGVCLWLHGHRHVAYWLAPTAGTFPRDLRRQRDADGPRSYGEYAIEGSYLKGLRRVYDLTTGAFRDGETFELELRIRSRRGWIL